jgi:hypothetical protein
LPKTKTVTLERLRDKIQGLRHTLRHAPLEDGLTSPGILTISQRLDALLVEYTSLAEGSRLAAENRIQSIKEKFDGTLH